jgi:hypothetical protein
MSARRRQVLFGALADQLGAPGPLLRLGAAGCGLAAPLAEGEYVIKYRFQSKRARKQL